MSGVTFHFIFVIIQPFKMFHNFNSDLQDLPEPEIRISTRATITHPYNSETLSQPEVQPKVTPHPVKVLTNPRSFPVWEAGQAASTAVLVQADQDLRKQLATPDLKPTTNLPQIINNNNSSSNNQGDH